MALGKLFCSIWLGGRLRQIWRIEQRRQQNPDRRNAFETLKTVLRRGSPPDLGTLEIGEPTRLPGDVRDIPTLKHPYATVPILFESAGIKRIVILAYLIVWAWEEHKI